MVPSLQSAESFTVTGKFTTWIIGFIQPVPRGAAYRFAVNGVVTESQTNDVPAGWYSVRNALSTEEDPIESLRGRGS
jgi:hypothetical protein